MGIVARATFLTVNVFPYRVTVPGVKPSPFLVDTYIVINPELWNTASSIIVTESGIVIDVKLVAFWNV
jgi:hypothetical protein